MAIQVRRGNEVDFDPSKMLPGEWAVSLDTKYVRMCFSPGVCLRMATYEAFETDMVQIQTILAECKTIQEAVARIQTEINDTAVVVEDYAVLAQSYAVGGTGTRENEDSDNAKYYYEQAKHISQGGNGLIPLGTIAFENLPTEDILTNGMYNISNDFTSDERFIDGGGVLYGKGSNVYYTVNGLWDVLASSDVKGVKGANESEYRQGNVSLSAKDVGALPTTGGRIGNDDAHIDINGSSIVGDTNSQIRGFDTISATYFNGDLNGTANKAEQDKDGNNIAEQFNSINNTLKNLRMQIFFDVSELGITSYALKDIINAMPEGSVFMCNRQGEIYNANTTAGFPKTFGVIIITKVSVWTISAESWGQWGDRYQWLGNKNNLDSITFKNIADLSALEARIAALEAK